MAEEVAGVKVLLYKQAVGVWILTPRKKPSVVSSTFYISAGGWRQILGAPWSPCPQAPNNSPNAEEKHWESWAKEPRQMEIDCELWSLRGEEEEQSER